MKTGTGKKWICGAGALAVCCMLTGCHMNHEWQEATCTTPRTCSVGGETEGEALGHTWLEATCTEPKHCSVCGEAEGDVLEHSWEEATCSEPKHCSVCGETEGSPLKHTLTEANYQQPATCTVCGKTVGEPLTAVFEEDGTTCDTELDVPYPYTVLCQGNPKYTTTGTVTFSEYETFASDETHEALDGYEWRAVTMTFVFEDENAYIYGWSIQTAIADYYYNHGFSQDEAYTINYNGEDYDECMFKIEESEFTEEQGRRTRVVYRYAVRVPEGYDGIVVCSVTNLPDVTDDGIYTFFRLK